jgi:hypothetical protein
VVLLALFGSYGFLRSGAQGPPRIEVLPSSYDFGEISSTEKAEVGFQVKNAGRSPLEITRVSTSCGCTTAQLEDQTLLPGEATTLHVTFDPQLMRSEGLIEIEEEILRIVYIKSNDPDRPEVEIELRGRVIPSGGEKP